MHVRSQRALSAPHRPRTAARRTEDVFPLARLHYPHLLYSSTAPPHLVPGGAGDAEKWGELLALLGAVGAAEAHTAAVLRGLAWDGIWAWEYVWDL